VVPAGSRTNEAVVVLSGPVDVYGTVAGDAVVFAGDLTIHPGATVEGDAVSVFGKVTPLPGSTILGGVKGSGSRPEAGRSAARENTSTLHQLKVSVGWLVVLLVIGLGVLVTASPYLDGVTETLEVGFARALFAGFAGQLLVLPALLAIVVGLAVTLLGILAIPLAVVAFIVALAGLLTLGFLATSFVTGRSLMARRGSGALRAGAARGDALQALLTGLVLYLSLWILAAALTSLPAAAATLRAVAFGVTWVAVTAGFGAALLSRAGTRRPAAVVTAELDARPASTSRTTPVTDRAPRRDPVPAWQTPTPITGVVAARRPTPVPPRRE
jgi:hypothetical protein